MRYGAVLEHERGEVGMMVARGRQGGNMYLVFAILALLGGLVLAGSPLAATRPQRIQLSARGFTRWWVFLLAKMLLVLATCFVLALEACGRISLVLTGSIQPLVWPSSTCLSLLLPLPS